MFAALDPTSRLRTWWQETHSPQLELCRHFFGQFFESEFVSTPGQLKALLAGVLSVLASLMTVFLQAYYHKYLLLKKLDDLEPFRLAVMADVLFLISLTMVLIGLVTTLQWQSLFPDRRDYLALAALPVRAQEMFRAKFASLFVFVALVALALTLPPSLGLPVMMHPQRSTPHFNFFGTMSMHVPGIFLACFGAALFIFFVLVALQGLLLNVLPLRLSSRVSLMVQAALLLIFLAGIPFAIAIPRFTSSMATLPGWAAFAPPLWFLGWDQLIAGSADPQAARLTHSGIVALIASAAAAIAAYWWSYSRHRIRVLESPAAEERTGFALPAWLPSEAEFLISDERSSGVFGFIAKTLGRSRHHRLILAAFVGISFAIIAESSIATLANGSRQLASLRNLTSYASIVAAGPLSLSLFTLCGLRYLFRLPIEPKANWIFRICAPGRTAALLAGVENFLLCGAVIPAALLCLPVEILLLGLPRGAIVGIITIPPSLILTEVLLFPCVTLPFTSLYLPARRMVTETLIQYGVGMVLYISVLSSLLGWCAYSPLRWIPVMALMVLVYGKLRAARIETQRSLRLEFEELPEVVVQTLGIERD